MAKIKYKRANAVGVVDPVITYEEESEKKTFNWEDALQVEVSPATLGTDGSFFVDDSSHLALVEALDSCAGLCRAGGHSPVANGNRVRTT